MELQPPVKTHIEIQKADTHKTINRTIPLNKRKNVNYEQQLNSLALELEQYQTTTRNHLKQLNQEISTLTVDKELHDQLIQIMAETSNAIEDRTTINEKTISLLQDAQKLPLTKTQLSTVQSGLTQKDTTDDYNAIQKGVNETIEKVQQERKAANESTTKEFLEKLDKKFEEQIKKLNTPLQEINDLQKELKTNYVLKADFLQLKQLITKQDQATSRLLNVFFTMTGGSAIVLLCWLWYYTHQ